jgi:hypothetical protein
MISFKEDADAKPVFDALNPRLWFMLLEYQSLLRERNHWPNVVITQARGKRSHRNGNAMDVRSRDLVANVEDKLCMAGELNKRFDLMFGYAELPWVIYEYPYHPDEDLRNPEHFHFQVAG